MRKKPDLEIAAEHPVKDIIIQMLVRRGDVFGVAQGRALAIVERLIGDGWIDRKKALRDVAKHRKAK